MGIAREGDRPSNAHCGELPRDSPGGCDSLRSAYNIGMNIISVQDIQRDPLGCLRRVEEGETLVVVRGEHPVAEIKPIRSPVLQPRPFGLCRGQFRVLGDFDQPLHDEFLKEFEGR